MREYLILQNENMKIQIEEIKKKIEQTLIIQKNMKKEILLEKNAINIIHDREGNPNLQDKNNELFIIQEKSNFYREAILKLKGQIETSNNVKK